MTIDSQTVLPNSFLRCMSPEDRASLGKADQTFEGACEKGELKSEKELQRLIANWLTINEIYFVRQRMDKKSNLREGTPDFLVCFKGQFIALEVKVGGNHPTPEQERELQAVRDSGGKAFPVRSLDEVRTILKGTNENTN
jgi:hypothetical protein